MRTHTQDVLVQNIRETRQQMRLNRKLLEIELDMADVLVGPSGAELERAEDEAGEQTGPAFGGWWVRQFSHNWPEGKRRRRWMPWQWWARR